MIVVEGPDGAGKSSLIRKLVRDIENITVADRVVSEDAEAMVDLVSWTEANLKKGLVRQIFDRHRLISEPIYGPTLRPRPSEGFENLTWVMGCQRVFEAMRPWVIFCLPPLDEVVKNVSQDPSNWVVAEKIEQIYWLYFHRITTHRGPFAVWDYTCKNPDEQYALLYGALLSWMNRKDL